MESCKDSGKSFNSHLNSISSSPALFLLCSRIVSIFSKFCGSPNDREINHLLLYDLTSANCIRNFTSTSFCCDQLARRFWYRVHAESVEISVEGFKNLIIYFFSLFVTQHRRAKLSSVHLKVSIATELDERKILDFCFYENVPKNLKPYKWISFMEHLLGFSKLISEQFH